MDLSNFGKYELIRLYGEIIDELKNRKVIRSKNIVGDFGEYLAIEYYTKTPGLPKLQATPAVSKNIDAVSIKGDRYTIKCTTGSITGSFYGLNPTESRTPQKQLFEYVIIVILDNRYQLKKIIELSWESFLKHKKWHSRTNAWYLMINKKLLDDATIIFESQQQ